MLNLHCTSPLKISFIKVRLVFKKEKASLESSGSHGDREQRNAIQPNTDCHHSSNRVVPADEQRNSSCQFDGRKLERSNST
jgi:hypothetical protein